MLVVPARRRRHDGHPPARGAPRRRAAGRVRAAAVGRDRGPVGDRRRARRPARRRPPSATRCGPASSSSCCPGMPGTDVPPGRRRRRPAADGQGRRRDRRAARRRRRRRPGRPPAPRRRDPARRAHRGPGVGRHLGPAARRGPRQGQLRHRRRRRERRQPAPPRRRPGHRRGRDRAVRLRRHDGRLLQRHHPLRVHRASRRPRSPRPTPCCTRPSRPSVAAATVGTPCQDVDRVGPADHRRRRLRRLLRPPHRPRHRHGGARGPVHRRGQRAPARRRPRLQRRAGHLRARPVGDAPRGHRRRHRRRPGRRSTPSDHALVRRSERRQPGALEQRLVGGRWSTPSARSTTSAASRRASAPLSSAQ